MTPRQLLSLALFVSPLVGCGGAALPPAAPPAAVKPVGAPTGLAPQPLFTAKSTSVTLELAEVPPTRVRCVAANASTGREVRVEWDPADLTSLVKHLDLPGTVADWKVACAADKNVLSSSGLLYELSFVGGVCMGDAAAAAKAAAANPLPPGQARSPVWMAAHQRCTLSARELKGSASTNGFAAAPEVQNVDVVIAPGTAPRKLGLVPATPPIAPGDRSVDPVSGVGADLLKILAEIAVDRAKQGTFELVRDTLKRGVCDDVTAVKGAHAGKPLLPRTCETLTSLRLEDLSAASTNLGRPLAQDFTRLAAQQMTDRLDETLSKAFSDHSPVGKEHLKVWLNGLIEETATLAYDVAAGGQDPDRMAHALLTRLGDAPIGTACALKPYDDQCAWAVGVEVVLQILGTCAAQEGTCKPADVARMIGAPEVFLTPNGGAPFKASTLRHFQRLRTDWPEIDVLVMKGLEVIQPRPGVTRRETAANVVELVAGLLEQRLCADDPEDTSCRSLLAGRDLVLAVLRDQSHQTLVAGVKVLLLALGEVSKDKLTFEQQRAIGLLTQLAGTVTAYAATYTEDVDGDPEKEKQIQETRRRAVEGFIDAYTDRSTRGGQWIASVGGLAGFGVGGVQTTVSSGSKVDPVIPHLSIPMGLAIQRLPQRDYVMGFHSQISFLDLAQFVATDGEAEVFEPTWANAFTIGGAIGFLLGTSTSSVMLGTDVRYSPALNSAGDDVTTARGAFRWSIGMAGYYVPFLDLN